MADQPKGDPNHLVRDRIYSWKAIADHLRKDVRTAQRWEEQEVLPIHRDGVKVFAYTDEIDQWREARIKGPSPQTAQTAAAGEQTDAPQQTRWRRDPRSAVAAI